MVATPTSTVRARPRLGPDWNRLWSAGASSLLGDGMLVAAMPLLATTITTDARQIAAVATAGGLPWLVLSLPAGALADRLDRRALMLGSQGVQAALAAVIAILATTGTAQIWMLCVLAFGMVSAETVFRGAGEAVVPAIVAREHLVAANARQQASLFIAQQSIGPPLGAALFSLALPLPFWLHTVTFAVSLLLISRIRSRPGFRPRVADQSIVADVAEGLRWLARSPLIRTLTGLAAVANMATFMAMSTMVLYAEQVLRLDERGYGLLLGAIALGGVLGALISNRVVSWFGLRRALLIVPFLAPLTMLAIGFFGREAVTVGVLAAGGTLGLSLWNVVSFTLRQLHVPTELLGRVGGAAKMIAFGASPIGAMAGGFIAYRWGLAAPWIAAGAFRLLITLLALPVLSRQKLQPTD